MDQRNLLSGDAQRQFVETVDPRYAELCTALYERELVQLSWSGPSDATLLKRRLASLPTYIKRASHALLRLEHARQAGQAGLPLDAQNASWQAKQRSLPPSAQHNPQKLTTWLQKHARLGLVLPVQIQHQQLQTVYLDSIDQLDLDNATPRIHLNRYGWFLLDGRAVDEPDGLLLKPSKLSMTAACCGHQWSLAGRKLPRALSLREVLLAATLDWPRFTKVVAFADAP